MDCIFRRVAFFKQFFYIITETKKETKEINSVLGKMWVINQYHCKKSFGEKKVKVKNLNLFQDNVPFL